MDINRLTEKAQEALRAAQSEATRLGHQQIDVEHLLLALLNQEGGLTKSILDKTAVLARERSRLYGQLQIYTAQGRITGIILCVAPFVMCGVLSALHSVVAHDRLDIEFEGEDEVLEVAEAILEPPVA